MENSVKFDHITLLIEASGPDEVHLKLDVPTGFPNMGYQTDAKICIQAAYGLEWVRKTFGREPDSIVSMKTGTVK